ncbi:MAG: hypothetical protein HY047_18950 [Acidobacteria bacterium]|nr:hypothetical protein [Acidobacteriota bacterium]
MWILFALNVVVAVPAPPAVDASKLLLSAPASIVEFDTGKLKGDLTRLTWAQDARQVYLQTVERDRAGNVKTMHHYVLTLDGKPPKGVDAEPPWSAAYWSWKSTQTAPGLPTLKIDVEQQQKRVSGTSIPMGGDLARGGVDAGGSAGGAATGFGTGDAVSAALQSQMVNVFTLKLKGEVVGEFVNAPAMPGLTFGWAPAGSGLIAFSNPSGRLVIMDYEGRTQEVVASKAALLPAWSDDGRRLAYLEKTGKNKAALRIIDVARPE